jgi:ribosomal protein L37E
MKMTICEKCGSISYYDHYFRRYICSSCRHSQQEKKVLYTPKNEEIRKLAKA